MKIHVVSLLFYLGFHTANSQTTFNKTYDFNFGSDLIYTTLADEDGYVLIGGGYAPEFDNWFSIKLAKIDFEGNLIWQKLYGESEIAYSAWFFAEEFPDGSMGFAGVKTKDDLSDIYIFKFNPDTGDSIFSAIVELEGEQQGYCIRGLDNGDMIISAVTSAVPDGGIYFIKTDSLGNVMWENDYSIAGALTWCGYFTINDAGNIEYVSSYEPCGYGFRINEIDTSGLIVGLSVIGDGCARIAKKSINDGYLVQGIYSPEWYQEYFAKLDENLDSLWNYRTLIRDDSIGFVEGQIAIAGFVELEDASVVIAGFYDSYPTTDYHAYISKLTPSGEELWCRQYTIDSIYQDSWIYHLLAAEDGGFLLSGTGHSEPLNEFGYSTQNFWVLKLDSMGCLTPGCDSLDVAIFDLPSDEAGILIYPNPVSTEAIVQITLNNPQEFTQLDVKLFDINGRMVSINAVDVFQVDGNKIRFGFQRNNLLSGIYLLQIKSGDDLIGIQKLVVE